MLDEIYNMQKNELLVQSSTLHTEPFLLKTRRTGLQKRSLEYHVFSCMFHHKL